MRSLLDTHEIIRGRKLTVGIALFCSGRPRGCCHIQDISIITLIWAGTDDFKFVRHCGFSVRTTAHIALWPFGEIPYSCHELSQYSSYGVSFLFLDLTAWSQGYLANSQDCLHRSKELCKMTTDSLWWCSGQSALLLIDSKHSRGCAIEFTVFLEALESVFVWSVSPAGCQLHEEFGNLNKLKIKLYQISVFVWSVSSRGLSIARGVWKFK